MSRYPLVDIVVCIDTCHQTLVVACNFAEEAVDFIEADSGAGFDFLRAAGEAEHVCLAGCCFLCKQVEPVGDGIIIGILGIACDPVLHLVFAVLLEPSTVGIVVVTQFVDHLQIALEVDLTGLCATDFESVLEIICHTGVVLLGAACGDKNHT